jgi:hypothetical protein
MSLRDVGFRGWALVTATVAVLMAFLLLALSGLLFQSPWDLLGVAFGFGVPILALFTIWYLLDVVWRREIVQDREPETRQVEAMGAAEALLRLMDYVDNVLDRLTRYTGWFFFFMLLALFLVPLLLSFGLPLWALASPLFWVLPGVNLGLWIAYFYYYYKIKHESDVWKGRLKRLRERARTLQEP